MLRLVEIELPVPFSPHFSNTFSVSGKATEPHTDKMATFKNDK